MNAVDSLYINFFRNVLDLIFCVPLPIATVYFLLGPLKIVAILYMCLQVLYHRFHPCFTCI